MCSRTAARPRCNQSEKLALSGNSDNQLVLHGYRVDLADDTIALPDPKMAGARNLIHADGISPGYFTIPLQIMQELRRSMNHWACTNSLWRRLVEPINQMISQTDPTLLRILCGNLEKRLAFWHFAHF